MYQATAVAHKTRVTKERNTGLKITRPNQAVNEKEAVKKMAASTFEERAVSFYEKEGFPVPNLDRMDKIEKLQTLEQMRQRIVNTKTKLTKQQKDIENERSRITATKAKSAATEPDKSSKGGSGEIVSKD